MIKQYGENVIRIREQILGKGLVWNEGKLDDHLVKRKKRKHIPEDWTTSDYESKIKKIVSNLDSEVYRYSKPEFKQDTFVFGDGELWIVMVEEDGTMTTSFPFKSEQKYRNYLNVDDGYNYVGTVKEVREFEG